MSTLISKFIISTQFKPPPPLPYPATLLIIISWILSLCTKYFGSTLAFHDISDDISSLWVCMWGSSQCLHDMYWYNEPTAAKRIKYVVRRIIWMIPGNYS